MLKRWKPVEGIDALGGDGVIAGEMSGDPAVPDGLLTVNGVPTTREIEVRDRKTRRVVSVRRSNPDGTYRFPGLNPALQYDVIARDFADAYEDVIAGAVSPHTPDLLVPVAAGDKMAAFSDPFAPNVVSLLHFDGTDGGTTFTDETGIAWTAAGNAQIDTTRSKFGASALLLDGSGDYAWASGASLNLGGGYYTVEGWAYYDSTEYGAYRTIFSTFSDQGQGRIFVLIEPDGDLFYGEQGPFGSPNLGGAASVKAPFQTWFHWAAVRSGTTMRLFKDGVKIGEWTAQPVYNFFAGHFRVGRLDSGSYEFGWLGSIDELRITKGVARYTSNFTPPTAPFEL